MGASRDGAGRKDLLEKTWCSCEGECVTITSRKHKKVNMGIAMDDQKPGAFKETTFGSLARRPKNDGG